MLLIIFLLLYLPCDMQTILKKNLKPRIYLWFSLKASLVNTQITGINSKFSQPFSMEKKDLRQAIKNMLTLKCLEWYVEPIYCLVTIYIYLKCNGEKKEKNRREKKEEKRKKEQKRRGKKRRTKKKENKRRKKKKDKKKGKDIKGIKICSSDRN